MQQFIAQPIVEMAQPNGTQQSISLLAMIPQAAQPIKSMIPMQPEATQVDPTVFNDFEALKKQLIELQKQVTEKGTLKPRRKKGFRFEDFCKKTTVPSHSAKIHPL